MYRDDRCAVCGEALPPDHVYCREHGAQVDARLHDAAASLQRAAVDLGRGADLLAHVAEETFAWLADGAGIDADWPPRGALTLTVPADDVDVDVDAEPGRVRVRLEIELATLLRAVADRLEAPDVERFVRACADAQGADTTG